MEENIIGMAGKKLTGGFGINGFIKVNLNGIYACYYVIKEKA